jgi:hypothetical protein
VDVRAELLQRRPHEADVAVDEALELLDRRDSPAAAAGSANRTGRDATAPGRPTSIASP